jgi:hypothetical protein
MGRAWVRPLGKGGLGVLWRDDGTRRYKRRRDVKKKWERKARVMWLSERVQRVRWLPIQPQKKMILFVILTSCNHILVNSSPAYTEVECATRPGRDY